VLDRRAIAIVRAASPFGRFTADMLKESDQIVVTSRFRFTRDEGLETTLSQSVR
jgi:protein TonB